MYDYGELFKEKEWHDSYIFDVVRKRKAVLRKNYYRVTVRVYLYLRCRKSQFVWKCVCVCVEECV